MVIKTKKAQIILDELKKMSFHCNGITATEEMLHIDSIFILGLSLQGFARFLLVLDDHIPSSEVFAMIDEFQLLLAKSQGLEGSNQVYRK